MKIMWKVVGVLTVMVVVAFGSVGRADAALVGIDPPSQTVAVGDVVTIDLVVSDLLETLGGFSAVILFDPAVLGGVSFTVDPDGYFDNALDLSGGFGPDSLDLFLVGDPLAFVSSFRLATASFTALGAGGATLTLSDVVLSDALGTGFLLPDVEDGQVSVQVPEPTAVTLLGTGVALVAALRQWAARGSVRRRAAASA